MGWASYTKLKMTEQEVEDVLSTIKGEGFSTQQ